ncbi:acylneuraminate cytidylyltransferase family protein [Thiolapillus brandeum]|uniref:N-acylneuraminate cytidylyltransferase n=1 Tax=Thiolapillus brandeum TaxID=1076588 RepID=A0A7U6GHE4_9GAMM|nr:acylneuraminate cytidylyltransferase family protein [Thiolapillus brandeum]BAO43681.1 N-acylneuraminate cytidylyltransferase [Thiolapillus brandeum]
MNEKAALGSKKIIAIIPARAGSKRLPGKNMLDLGGKPLVQWSMDAALESGVFQEVYVSSDEPAILDLARRLGTVAVKRPAALATDQASLVEVVKHVLEQVQEKAALPDAFMLLQPTSPLRTADDIRQAARLWRDTRAPAVISVCEAHHSPLWCGILDEDGGMDEFIAAVNNRRSQELPQYHCLNGAIYLLDSRVFLARNSFLPDGARAYLMPRERSVDVDTSIDHLFANFLIKHHTPNNLP